MINTLHLLWIIPLCLFVGFIDACWWMYTTRPNREADIYEEGVFAGKRMTNQSYENQTLRDWFTKEFGSDFKGFKDTTGGIIYGIDSFHQMYMIFIDHPDELERYYDWEIQGVSIDGSNRHPMIKELV